MGSRHGVPTPGQSIVESMEWLKMDKTEFARRLGISEDLLDKLIAGDVGISAEVAASLESVTGSPAAFWKMLEHKSRRNRS